MKAGRFKRELGARFYQGDSDELGDVESTTLTDGGHIATPARNSPYLL